MTHYPITYTYRPSGVYASVPALVNLGTTAPTYEEARARIEQLIALHVQLKDDEAGGPLPTILDACPCPDCGIEIIWTVLNDVRTAWSVHLCPRSGGRPL